MNKENLSILLLRLEHSQNSGVRRINELSEQMEKMCDFKLIETKLFRYKNIKFFGFFISLFLEFWYSFYFFYLLGISNRKYKIVYLWPMSYTYLWLIPSLRIIKKFVIVDYNDDFYELSNKKNFFREIIFFLYYKIPQSIVPYLSNYLIVTPFFKKRFIKQGISKEKMIAVTTGYNPSLFKISRLKKEKNKNIEIGYFGSIDKRFDMNFIVKSFSEINNPKIRLNLFGRVAENHSKINDSRIIYHGKISHNKVPDYMKKIDILLNPFPYSLLANSASPVKIFEYMALGGCILSADVESIKGVLKHGKNAYLYISSDKEDFKEKLINLINDEELRRKLSKQALKDSKRYTWNSIARKIIRELNKRFV
jgi:glycosyltransferase involved in cell wall biosynthesis